MQPEARQRKIEEYLSKVEFASLEELAREVEASVSTVRRDVTVLEEGGHIRRTHGGARVITPRSDEFAFSTRDTHQIAEKEQIARACADLIAPNQTIIIDAGTTCFHVARYLESKTLHILTNSLPVANHFGSSHRAEVIVSGGVIYPRLGVLVGPLAVEAFSRLRADIAVMSCGGITAEGVTNSHGLLIDIQRAMMHAATRVILCVDHSKFGRQSISRLCGIESLDTLVTDLSPPNELLAACEKHGVEVIVAGVAGPQTLLGGIRHPDRRRGIHEASAASPTAANVVPQENAAIPADTFERDRFID